MNKEPFPSRVTLFSDGVYRWSYDMDMYRNHYLRNVLLKILGAICAVSYIFLLLLLPGYQRTLRTALLCSLPFLGALALTLVIYYICAAAMHGVYHLRFEMDEDVIQLVRKTSTQRMMDVTAGLATLADVRVGHSLQSSADSGRTRFDCVRAVTEHPEYNALNLRGIASANQIWIPKEDYEFVRDFILARVPKKARKARKHT